MLTAVARALHRAESSPTILDDPFALPLTGDEGPALIKRLKAAVPPETLSGFSRWICVRARLPEDIVEGAVAEGVSQYVILGAGLDSFAYRRADLQDRLRVFEVDHPASQAWKEARLHELGVDRPTNLVFAPVDFETQTLREGLATAGFDFGAAAVFSWIGVTMYLTLGAIEATLSTVAACAADTRIVLTYNLSSAAMREMGLETGNWFAGLAAEMGEPFVSLFTPNEAEALLRSLGFVDIKHFGPNEAIQKYFDGREDVRLHGPQRLISARVVRPPAP